MNTIGIVELNSIAKGIEAADGALKAAEVQLISAHAGCPGKFYLLFCGDTAAAQEAFAIAVSLGGEYVVDQTLLTNVHPDVIAAMSKTTPLPPYGALGIMEFFSVSAAVYAADAAVKAAAVSLLEVRAGTGIGGKAYVLLSGDVAATQAAVDAGSTAEHAQGMLLHRTVLASPAPALLECLY